MEVSFFLINGMAISLLWCMKISILLGSVLIGCITFVVAQEDTQHHRKIYQDINNGLATMETVGAKGHFGDHTVELKGWHDKSGFRKIVAAEPSSGATTEYYLEGVLPVFVYRLGKDSDGNRVEERCYFRDGGIFKWLSTERNMPVLHAEDYEATSEMHLRSCEEYLGVLQAKRDKGGEVLMGVFTGVEQGDYFHWLLKTEDGRERSFFILHPTAEMNPAMDHPEKFKGMRCRIRWRSSMENLPEAGGDVKVDQIVAVEWLD